jgi:nitrogen regulatory protein P-II 1
MKQIQIVIPDSELDALNEILKNAHVGGMSHYRMEGREHTKPEEVEFARGTMKYTPEYIPRVKVEVVVKDEQVEELITNILNGVGNAGGKIFVVDVPIVVDLRTSKRGESAL